MWFSDAPAPAATLGNAPHPVLRYAAEPNDGTRVWALGERSVGHLERQAAEEFGAMPDSLLHSEAYHLTRDAGVVLPEELAAALEEHAPALSAATHPFTPSLVVIGGKDVMGVRRVFGALACHVAMHRERWFLAICPRDVQPVLRLTPA